MKVTPYRIRFVIPGIGLFIAGVMVVSGREGLIRSETMSRGANAQVNDYKMAGHGLYARDRPNYSWKGPQHMMDAIHVGR